MCGVAVWGTRCSPLLPKPQRCQVVGKTGGGHTTRMVVVVHVMAPTMEDHNTQVLAFTLPGHFLSRKEEESNALCAGWSMCSAFFLLI